MPRTAPTRDGARAARTSAVARAPRASRLSAWPEGRNALGLGAPGARVLGRGRGLSLETARAAALAGRPGPLAPPHGPAAAAARTLGAAVSASTVVARVRGCGGERLLGRAALSAAVAAVGGSFPIPEGWPDDTSGPSGVRSPGGPAQGAPAARPARRPWAPASPARPAAAVARISGATTTASAGAAYGGDNGGRRPHWAAAAEPAATAAGRGAAALEGEGDALTQAAAPVREYGCALWLQLAAPVFRQRCPGRSAQGAPGARPVRRSGALPSAPGALGASAQAPGVA